MSCYFTMLAKDANGDPCAQLSIDSEIERGSSSPAACGEKCALKCGSATRRFTWAGLRRSGAAEPRRASITAGPLLAQGAGGVFLSFAVRFSAFMRSVRLRSSGFRPLRSYAAAVIAQLVVAPGAGPAGNTLNEPSVTARLLTPTPIHKCKQARGLSSPNRRCACPEVFFDTL